MSRPPEAKVFCSDAFSGQAPSASSLTSMLLVLDLPDPKRSDQNTFASEGLFLISSLLNLEVFSSFAGAGEWSVYA